MTETAAKKTESKPVTAKVYARNGSVLFEGALSDAEIYIANNFPRMHSVEAGPDFTVVTSPKGRKVTLPDGYETADTTED